MSLKLCSLIFEEVASQDHWADFAAFGPCISSDTQLYRTYHECDIKLSPDESWQVSFDQSTSCTGIFIKNFKNTQAYMIEVSKNRNGDADSFIFELEMFLHSLLENCIVTHLIYERPIITKNYQSSRVLFQLEGSIRALVKRYPEFHNARMEFIENSSWRRVVILPQFSSYEKKTASEQSIKTIFPWTSLYGFSLGSDKDIFESIGVMFGWFINSFDGLGRPYVRGDRFNGSVGGFILPDVTSKDVTESFLAAGIESVWAMENPRKSIYENLVCAVQKHKVTCVEVTDPSTMLCLFVECGFKWTHPERLTVVLVAANYVDSRLFEITGDTYHFIL